MDAAALSNIQQERLGGEQDPSSEQNKQASCQIENKYFKSDAQFKCLWQGRLNPPAPSQHPLRSPPRSRGASLSGYLC